jgi:hypothetical protein
MPSWANMMRLGFDGKSETVIGSLLHEVHQAVRGNMRRLAAMGIRSLIEHLMVSRVGDLGTFQKNLDVFHEKGYISLVQRDCVRTLLDAGDAATHRAFEPTIDDLNTALDIVEGILAAIYDQSEKAAQLGAKRWPRLSEQLFRVDKCSVCRG